MNATLLATHARDLENRSPEQVLTWASTAFGADVALVSSFAAEGMVLIDMVHRLGLSIGVITLDTGRLHEETYELMERVRRRYGVTIRSYFPDRSAVERLERESGFYSFRSSLEARQACCGIRKVAPLKRALAELSAWVTGLRREQAVTRTRTAVVEWDAGNGLVKVNPLVAWAEPDVWDYIRAYDVPYNVLHDRGFPSIGCAPCTRAVAPGEDQRAGRWWWEQPEHKECGLHPVHAS